MSEEQSTLNALAFIYIGFAHSTDGELAPEEMKTLAAHIKEWQPNAPLEQIGEVLQEAVALYQATDPLDRTDAFRRHGEAIKQQLDANARVMELLIVAGIWYLAVVTVLSFGQSRLELRFARGAGKRS